MRCDRLSLGVDTRKRRQQRRVNVQDAVAVLRDERGAEQAHVSGQHDVVRLRFVERAQHVGFMRLAIRIAAVVDDVSRVAPAFRARDARRVAAVGDHADDPRIELAALDRLMDCREVRTAPRKENGQADHSIQLAKPAGGASYCTVPVPLTTLPMKKNFCPVRAKCFVIVSTWSTPAMMTMPMPMLNTRSISSLATFPFSNR